MMKRAVILTVCGLSWAQADDEKKVVRGHVFAWPFTEVEKMQPRGGTTKGTEVVLDKSPGRAWEKLYVEEVPLSIERDRRAILALAGSYRVSFDFIETMGFTEGYKPQKPYFSWGTEHVQVIAEEPEFISLQHTLVMYFKDKDGKESGPMVMKHWRQDWKYEDTDLHTFRGKLTWTRETRKPEEVDGKWTQSVYQVDDSPRYEVVGEWNHGNGMSVWRSESSWRPLPRREFSVRDDYDVLQGTHEIAITASGWVHTQQNQKLKLGKKGRNTVLAQEYGVNRYERITSPTLKPAEIAWKKTGAYWGEVRKAWAEVFEKNETFSLKPEFEDKKLYQHHFGYAMKVENSNDAYDVEAGRKHAFETVKKFVVTGAGKKDGKY